MTAICGIRLYFINMRKITAIEPQKRNPQRVNIYLDGEFAFGLDRTVSAWLQVGQDLDEDKIKALQDKDKDEVVYQKALHFLSYRPRSSMEMVQNLQKRGISESTIKDTMARLRRNEMINDEVFARTWVENRNEFRPRSNFLLKLELRQKGLSEEIIESVLDRNTSDESLAAAAARKQVCRYRDLEWSDFRKKLGGFLVRRGFSYEIITPLVSKIWHETQMDDNQSVILE